MYEKLIGSSNYLDAAAAADDDDGDDDDDGGGNDDGGDDDEDGDDKGDGDDDHMSEVALAFEEMLAPFARLSHYTYSGFCVNNCTLYYICIALQCIWSQLMVLPLSLQHREVVYNFFQKELVPYADEIDKENNFSQLRVSTYNTNLSVFYVIRPK